MKPSADSSSTRKGLRAAQAIAERVRKEVGALALRHPTKDIASLLAEARKIVAKHEPLLARTIRDSLLAAWLEAARDTLPQFLPPPPEPASGSGGSFPTPPRSPGSPPGPPPESPFPDQPGEPEPVVRLPLIEEAAKDLRERRILLPHDFARLDQHARRAAFTVARVSSVDTIEKVRDALTEAIEEGKTLRDFRRSVGAALEASALGKHHVEAVYRTGVAQAYSAGQKEILESPLVRDAFPYVLFVATHDTRVSTKRDDDHLGMEKHGQNGTAVYRVDDPIWMTLYPPMRWNCRCALIPLSLEDAARHGSKEAQRWLRTGTPPAVGDFAKRPYPVVPPKGWPTHERIASVV